MTKRNPQFGDFYVFYADPREVMQVDAVMDGKVRYHSRVTGENFELLVDSFKTMYTRCAA